MNKFHLIYKQPDIPSTIAISEFNSKEFWEDVLEKFFVTISDLGIYYSIPEKDYIDKINIDFYDKWDKWDIKEAEIGFGYYSLNTNVVVLNPYLYLYCGRDAFLHTFYHELTHWVIEKVDYFNEYNIDQNWENHFHGQDFPITFENIFFQNRENYINTYEVQAYKHYIENTKILSQMTVISYNKYQYTY